MAADHGETLSDRPPAQFTDDAWIEVLSAMDRTCADLVSAQERLERQNAELQHRRTFLTAILSSVSDLLIVADRTGRVVQVSRSVAVLSGRDIAAPTGRPLAEMFASEAHATLAAILHRVRVRRRGTALEADLLTVAGVEPLEVSIAPRLDDRGRVDGFVLTGRPLCALRKANAERAASLAALETAQTQVVRNEKHASLGRLLAAGAHEPNNPISFVVASAHALERYAVKFATHFTRVQEGASREELMALRADLKLDREAANLRDAPHGAKEGAERVRDIVEDLSHTWMDGPDAHPRDGRTEPGAAMAAPAHAWCKAPRLNGAPVEVGALARQAVDGNPLALARDGGVPARVAGRLLEIARMQALGEALVAGIEPGARCVDHRRVPREGRGVGQGEAARGALGHWVRIEGGRSAGYQIVAPTMWNLSPRGAKGTPGPQEAALAGAPAEAGDTLSVQHIVRSFDPCMFCTVH